MFGLIHPLLIAGAVRSALVRSALACTTVWSVHKLRPTIRFSLPAGRILRPQSWRLSVQVKALASPLSTKTNSGAWRLARAISG